MCRGLSLYTHIHVRKENPFPLYKIAQICTQISQVREVFLIPIPTSVTQLIINFRTDVCYLLVMRNEPKACIRSIATLYR